MDIAFITSYGKALTSYRCLLGNSSAGVLTYVVTRLEVYNMKTAIISMVRSFLQLQNKEDAIFGFKTFHKDYFALLKPIPSRSEQFVNIFSIT